MNDPTTHSPAEPVTQERLLKALQDARERLQAHSRRDHEPVAILGFGGRLPGANEPAALWPLLIQGRSLIGPISAARDALVGGAWSQAPAHARCAGFLDDVDAFDHRLFGISPAEATGMDPQQRLLLQAAWSAIEDAAIDPSSLRHGAAGVWVGISNADYAQSTLRRDLAQTDAYAITGSGLSLAPGRIAHVLGLRGPALAIDTACSSSLVALHLAAQSLRRGECDLALVGGVQLLLEPDVAIGLDRMGALSPTGRCRTFDVSADGFVRGEGALCVVLARASDERALRVRPRGWILGSAVNQDGPSSGLTAPSGTAQAEVIRAALAAARVQPSDVSLVEAHGTGTPLGDPIELRALAAVFAGRNVPLPVGSVKSTIGHLEACAGLAGLVKLLLCMQHAQVPPQPGVEALTPHIDWPASGLQVPLAAQPWQQEGGRRVAGLSSFGFSGTNAHVVLADAPEAGTVAAAPQPQAAGSADLSGPAVVPLSARSEAALAALQQHWSQALAGQQGGALAALVRTTQQGRARLGPYRRAWVLADLGAPCAGLPAAAAIEPAVRGSTPQLVWLFTGQGFQYPGMGRQLLAQDRVFRDAFERLATALPDLPLKDWLERGDAAQLQRTEVQQPLGVALACALAAVWRSWGVRPDAVIGHSVGELSAAAVAGLLAPEEAVRLAALRGRLMQALPIGGGMLAVAAPPGLAQDLVERAADPRLAVAAFNGPLSQTLAGPLEALQRCQVLAQELGLSCRPLPVSHPFHTRWMEPMCEAWAAALRAVPWGRSSVALYSTRTGTRVHDADLASPGYWVEQVLAPVRFQQAVEAAERDAHGVYLEVGPAGGLAGLVAPVIAQGERAVAASLRPGQDERRQMLQAAATLHVNGVDIDWPATPPGRGPLCHGPVYPFEPARFWIHRPAVPARPGAALAPPAAASGTAHDTPLATAARSPADLWAAMAAQERPAQVLARLRQIITHVGGPGPDEPFDVDENLFSTGLDSITLVQARGMIAREFGVEVELSRFYDEASTLARLADWLNGRLTGRLSDRPGMPAASPPMAAPPEAPAAPHPTTTPAPGPQAPSTTLPNRPGRAVSADVMRRQRAYLAGFAPRYVAQTAGSREHVARHRPHLATGRNLAGFRADWKEIVYQIVGGEGHGARLRDIDGRDYIDFTMGFGVCLFGHAPEMVSAALRREIARGMPLGPLSDLAGDAAQRLTALTGTDRAAFFNTGSDAVMNALRIARTVRSRSRVVVFEGAYHGTFDGVLALQLQGRALPISPGTPDAMVQDLTVLRYGDPASLDAIERLGPELAAVLAEPVQSRHPDLQPQAFLRELRELTRRLDVPLILDEMITGFRCHPGGIQARWGVQADLVAYGKILGGGTPIGAVAGSARYMDAVDGGAWRYGDASLPTAATTFTSGTFCNHPLGMAAAQAVLAELQRQGPALQAELDRRTTAMCNRLNQAYADEGFPLRMVWFSSLFRFLFEADLELLFPHLVERGYYVWEGRNCFLSTAHTPQHIDGFAAAVLDSLRAMRAGGLIPERAPAVPDGAPAATPAPATLPVSPAQARVLLSHELHGTDADGAEAAYHLRDARVLEAPLDAARLARAWAQLVQRHEALRTDFERTPQGWRQRVHREGRAAVQWSVAAGPDAATVAATLSQPFDLEHAPLARLHVAQWGPHRHLVLLDAHHAVADGLSFAVLAEELWRLYAGERLPAAPLLSQALALLAQSADSAAAAGAANYWDRVYGPPLQAGELPVDRPHGRSMSYSAGVVQAKLEERDVSPLRDLARTQGVTLYAVLLTAWSVLLARLSEGRETVIGVPVSVRPQPGFERCVGMFVATVALRLPHAPGRPVAEALSVTARVLLESLDHAAHPIESILERVARPGRQGRHPLLDSMFEFETQPATAPQVDGQPLQPVALHDPHALFDLDAEAVLRGDALELTLRFRQEVYERDTAQAWLQAYVRVLQAMARNPGTCVGDLPLAEPPAPAPRQAAGLAQDDAALLHGAALRRLLAAPGAVALRAGGCGVTAGELHGLVRALAARLLDAGLAPEQPVAVRMRRSPAFIAALLAVNVAGGCHVPIDPDQPLARAADLLRGLVRPLLLTDADLWEPSLAALAGACVRIEPQALARQAGHAPPLPAVPVSPDMLAYLLFTSGSTGRPKAVAVSHRAAAAHVAWYVSRFGIGPGDVLLQKTVCTFDTALSEIYGSLWAGACLVLPGADDHLEFERLADLIVAEGVTVVEDVPSLVPLLLAEPRLRQARLRWYNPGGEALTAELARRITTVTGARVVNLYGPTEAAVDALHQEWDGQEHDGRVPIGMPVAGIVARVLDARLQPVPQGGRGELYLGGEQLARGYAGQPDLTADRFIPDPWGEPGQRLYRTGDRVRRLPDGRLAYQGRLDEQVKVRGQRVEPAEIEAALVAQGPAEAAVVKAFPLADGTVELVAYVQPAVAEGLRERLSAVLPRAWVPTRFVAVARWPRLPNGKLDRGGLLRPAPEAADPAGLAPAAVMDAAGESDPTLRAVLQAYAQTLGQSGIGPDDDFFALGGHSLTAVRVAAALKRDLAREVRVRAVFDHPTARALAAHLRHGEPLAGSLAEGPAERPPAAATQVDGCPAWPLNGAQRGVWLACHLSDDPAGYHMAEAYVVDGDLPAAGLRRALSQVAARQESLRTVFRSHAGGPLQLVVHGLEPDWVELPGSPGLSLAAAEQAFGPWTARPFDLERGPLVRLVFARLQGGHTFVGFVIHHLVFDGWSSDLLVEELAQALEEQAPVRGPGPTVTPAQLALEQAAMGEAARARLDQHWRQQLQGHRPGPELLPDRHRPPVRSLAGAQEQLVLDAAFEQSLSRAAGRRLTAGTLATAAALLLVHAQTGRADPSIGLLHAGRDDPRLQGVIGLFVNTLVIRRPLPLGMTARAWTQDVRDALVQALDHAELPYAELVSRLAPERQPGRQPLFDLAVNVLESELSDAGLHRRTWRGAAARRLPRPVVDAKFDLTLTLERSAGEPSRLTLEYATGWCDAADARRLLALGQRIMAALIEDRDESVAQLLDRAVPSPAARQALAWQSPAPALGEADLWERFEQVACTHPNAMALHDGTASLPYRELHARALACARGLAEGGVGPGDHVGLLAGPGAGFVCAMLGVLQRGAAYVPLDPDYPPQRLKLMQGLAGLKTVLAHGPAPAWCDAPVLPLEPTAPQGGPAPARRRMPGLAPAYIMFTSGSTDQPKPVLVPQQGVIRLVSQQPFVDLGPGGTVALASSLSFDAATLELWAALARGATMVVVPRAVLLDPAQLQAFLQARPLDLMWLTAGLFHAVARHRPQALGGVRRLMVGGDRVDPEALRQVLHSDHPPGRIVNGYGPTENTTFTTTWPVPPDAHDTWREAVPIGQPLAHTSVVVVDPQGRPVEPGQAGELLTGGLGLALGYYGQPALTAERFVPDPHGPPGARAYRTGDRVRWLSPGVLGFIGRLDRQVKIRGHRIEPAEVERALLAVAGVESAVVLPRELSGGDKQLVAWVLEAQPGVAARAAEALAQTLPRHLVPAQVVDVRSWPLNANGKVDAQALLAALPAAEPAAQDDDTPGAADDGPQLLALWRRVLARPALGLDDNFFASGGDSILAIQIASLAAQQGIPLRVHALFEAPTVRELAARLARERGPDRAAEAPGDEPGPLAATPIQRWFLDRALAHPSQFTQALALRTPGLTEAGMRAAVAAVAARHAAFGLRLQPDGQWSIAPGPWPVHHEAADLPEATGRESPHGLQGLVARLGQRLDVAGGPLLASAYRPPAAPGEGGLLVLVAHHLAVDGVSWRTLAGELEQACRSVAPSAPSAGLRAWAAWCERRAQALMGDDLERRHWHRMATRPGRVVPDDASAPNRAGAVLTQTLAWDPARSARLAQALQQRGWSWQVMILAAIARALAGDGPVGRFDVEGHGRPRDAAAPDVSGVVGWFTAVYPVAIEPVSTLAVEDWLKAADQALRQAPGEGAGWGLLRELARDPALRAAPPASVVLNFHGETAQRLGGFEALEIDASDGEHLEDLRSHDIEVTASLHQGALRLSWSAAAPRFAPARIRRWAAACGQALDLAEQALARARSEKEEDLPVPE